MFQNIIAVTIYYNYSLLQTNFSIGSSSRSCWWQNPFYYVRL